MPDNEKRVARIPIVPDDLSNQDSHKNRELVMDYIENDIYVKVDDGYVNITGKIKEDIKQIKDGSAVIHIVTEQSLPPIKDRAENHWYYVITGSEGESGAVNISNYIYYGLINTYYTNKNYILIAQNMIDGNGSVSIEILDGYCPCFYVPVNYSASFVNNDSGEQIPYSIEDRIYAMNTTYGTYTAYDVYTLELYEPGIYSIGIDLTGSGDFNVSFSSNELNIEGLVLPDSLKITDGDCIGNVKDPEWNDPRYIFKGWSTDSIAETIIDPSSYKPEDNMTLYAWFDYNDDESLITYYATYVSNGSNSNI